MTHVARLVTAVLGALCLAPIGAETARAQVPRDRALSASLVRCREQSTVTCVELDGGLTTALSSGRGSPSQSGEAAPSLELALGSPSFLGPLLYGKREVSEPTYLLVLLDVSGSMTGNGIAHTRAALKQFVQSLPNIGIRVTVVPFVTTVVSVV